MQFSEQWLREWVNPSIDSEALAAQLTMAGLEVDAMEAVAGAFTGVVVGEVLETEQHPDADKLRVTKVNVGADEPLQIVCGAANARPGIKVPCAVVGARLPGDFKIKKAKLRGVPSHGMLCSASELGLAESSEGLMELPADAPVGEDFRAYLQLDDLAIELGLTPNRSDCLSIAGIAREVGVLNKCEVTPPTVEAITAVSEDSVAVTLEAPEACPSYCGRVIRNINAEAETPLWMQERLRRSGIRSLSPVVDVTNYVLLELGQPMHGFDLAKLNGGIKVRMACEGEQLALLNDSEVTLDTKTLVIADEQGPLALAGVMGGAASAVSSTTRDIFLEAAFFAPELIAGRARSYGLHTDSSHRFERGVDYLLQRRAMERATSLILAICGGEPGPIVEQTESSALPQRQPITLRSERINRLLGGQIEAERVTDILQRLGMSVEGSEGQWLVTPPSFRFDITIEVDLIEEIGRIVGYSNLPSRAPTGSMHMQALNERQQPLNRLRMALVERAYQEAITYSFVDPKFQQQLDPERNPIALANPISADLSVMRTTLWAGLLSAAQHNIQRQQERVRLFESGLVFLRDGEQTRQLPMLAGVLFGETAPEQWASPARKSDFFDLKGDVEALLAISGASFQFEAASHPALHPGQSARVLCEGRSIGWLGALHPVVAKKLGLPSGVFVFELELAVIQAGTLPNFSELSKYPAVRRDIALVVDEAVGAGAMLATVRETAPESLIDLKLFDVYVGEHVDSGRKSLAMGLTFQAQSRTLTDQDVDTAMETVLEALGNKFNATLRD